MFEFQPQKYHSFSHKSIFPIDFVCNEYFKQNKFVHTKFQRNLIFFVFMLKYNLIQQYASGSKKKTLKKFHQIPKKKSILETFFFFSQLWYAFWRKVI
jgi:hypothetical protein